MKKFLILIFLLSICNIHPILSQGGIKSYLDQYCTIPNIALFTSAALLFSIGNNVNQIMNYRTAIKKHQNATQQFNNSKEPETFKTAHTNFQVRKEFKEKVKIVDSVFFGILPKIIGAGCCIGFSYWWHTKFNK